MNILNNTLNSISSTNKSFEQKAIERLNSLIKPQGSLGKLEDICIKLASIYESEYFDISKKIILGFAGDHGVYEEKVAPDPQVLTKMQIPNFSKGICGVGVLSKFANSDVWGVDVGINTDEKLEGVLDYKIRKGTSNMAKGPAMTREEAIKSIEIGIELAQKAIDEGYNMIGIGEMGICNTTPTSAIISVFSELDPIEVTGRGAGLNSEGVIRKANIIRKAISLNKPNKDDALDVLSKVGGFEIGAMTGAILCASANKIPVVLDGFISYSSAIIACNLNPICKEYMIASHFSAENASKVALNLIGIEPCLFMDMRLGEGSGAALMFNIIDAANYVYNNMSTFKEANMII